MLFQPKPTAVQSATARHGEPLQVAHRSMHIPGDPIYRAQPRRTVIGYIATGLRDKLQPELKSLSEIGFVEGKNLFVEYRWSEGRYDQLAGMAADLVGKDVALMAATGVPAALAAKAATATIPIVFVIGPDPVKFGLVTSLNRPGGNLTSATFFTSTPGPKRLEILRELLPKASVVGFLVNARNPRAQQDILDMEKAASILHCTLVGVRASSDRGLNDAFAHLAASGVGAVIVGADPFFHGRADHFVSLVKRYRLRRCILAGSMWSPVASWPLARG